jgi:alpha-glucosidase
MDECHFPANFQLIRLQWSAQRVRQAVDAYDAALPKGAWPNWVMGNHDRHRMATRVGTGQARVANMLLLTLRGTPTTYYGEEIGMENVPIPPEFIQDPPAVNQPEIADVIGRDPERTPMPWNTSPNAGFTTKGVTPWLPLADNSPEHNVARQETEPTSMLNFYRTLIKLRRNEPALCVGNYESIDAGINQIFAYQRTAPSANRFLIVLNFGSDSHTLDLSSLAHTATVSVATGMTRKGDVDLSNLSISPDEGLVLKL